MVAVEPEAGVHLERKLFSPSEGNVMSKSPSAARDSHSFIQTIQTIAASNGNYMIYNSIALYTCASLYYDNMLGYAIILRLQLSQKRESTSNGSYIIYDSIT